MVKISVIFPDLLLLKLYNLFLM